MSEKNNLMSNGYKLYKSDDINVFWKSEICQHAMECVKGNKKVFNPLNKPWIDLSQAPASEIADIIDRCPSGALKYELNKK